MAVVKKNEPWQVTKLKRQVKNRIDQMQVSRESTALLYRAGSILGAKMIPRGQLLDVKYFD
jgi:hypothetical protein